MNIYLINKLIFILASLFSLFGFDEMDPEEKIANKVSFKTVRKLEEKHGLKFVGMGLGNKTYPLLAYMTIDFNISRALEMNEARNMIVDCVEEYLSDINSSEELRPHILNSHFTFKNVSLGIHFYENGTNMKDTNDRYIGIVYLGNGQVSYFVYEKGCQDEKEIIREPYEEALAKVKGESY